MSECDRDTAVEIMGESVEYRNPKDVRLIWFLVVIVFFALGLALGGIVT